MARKWGTSWPKGALAYLVKVIWSHALAGVKPVMQGCHAREFTWRTFSRLLIHGLEPAY